MEQLLKSLINRIENLEQKEEKLVKEYKTRSELHNKNDKSLVSLSLGKIFAYQNCKKELEQLIIYINSTKGQ